MIIPKKEIRSLADVEPADERTLGRMMMAASQIARQFAADWLMGSSPDASKAIAARDRSSDVSLAM